MKSRFVKTLVAIAMAVTVMLLCMPMSLAAETSGKCGDDATWSYNAQTGELKIEGTGVVTWTEDWAQFDESLETPASATLKSLVISDGITDISALTWQGYFSLEKVTVPGTVTAEIAHAFVNQTSVEEIIFNGTKQQWDNIMPEDSLMLSEGIKVTCTDGTVEIASEFDGTDTESQSDTEVKTTKKASGNTTADGAKEAQGINGRTIIIIAAVAAGVVVITVVIAVIVIKKKK